MLRRPSLPRMERTTVQTSTGCAGIGRDVRPHRPELVSRRRRAIRLRPRCIQIRPQGLTAAPIHPVQVDLSSRTFFIFPRFGVEKVMVSLWDKGLIR